MKLLRYKPGGRIVLKVLDFGMAKQVGRADQRLTAPGILVGTPKYVAPEQVTENPVIDGRTDLYAAGVLFYELLTGQAPFLGTPHEVLLAHMSSQPRALPEAVPQFVSEIVMRLLRKRPEERFANAAELDQYLEECEATLRAPAMPGYSSSGSGMYAPIGASGSSLSGGVPSAISMPGSSMSIGSSATIQPASGMTPAPSGNTHQPISHPSGPGVTEARRGGRTGLWLLLGLLVLGGGGLVYGLQTVLPLQRAVAQYVPVFKVPQDEEVQRTLGVLGGALQNKQWAGVIDGVETLRRRFGATLLPAQVDEMNRIAQRAQLEQPMQATYEQLVSAAAQQDAEKVIRLYSQLAGESVYRTLAQPYYDSIVEGFISARLEVAEQLRQAHKCAEVTAAVQKLSELAPGHPQVNAAQRKGCTEAPPEGEGAPGTPGAPGAPGATDGATPEIAPSKRP